MHVPSAPASGEADSLGFLGPLTALRDPVARRAAIDRHLLAKGPDALLVDLERLFRRTHEGLAPAREVALWVASWLVHHLASAESARGGHPNVATPLKSYAATAAPLDRLREVAQANASAFPRCLALLATGKAAAALAKGGRLGEICLPARVMNQVPKLHTFVSESSLGRLAELEESDEPNPFEWIPPIVDSPVRATSTVSPPLVVDATRHFFGPGGTGTLPPLRSHHQPKVIERLLEQRWLRLRDAVLIAARRPSIPALSYALAARDRWFFQSPVREALAQNPFSPTALVLALLPTVTTSTRQRLARTGSDAVREALRVLDERAHSAYGRSLDSHQTTATAGERRR